MLLTESPEDSNSRFKLQAAIEFMSPASHFNFRIGKQIQVLEEVVGVQDFNAKLDGLRNWLTDLSYSELE